jgi:FeS assembly protein IscX
MARTWRDIDDLALDLAEAFPTVDPLSVSLPELKDLIVQLPNFGDDPHAVTSAALEAIQAAWYDEFED